MDKYFICDQERITLKLSELKEAGRSKDDRDHFFIDLLTREPWILTSYESYILNYEITILMMSEITEDDLIEISLTSNDLPTVAAAAMTIQYMEAKRKIEFRHKLIRKLEALDIDSLSTVEKERLRIIIYETKLHDGTNQRSIMGKHYQEVKKDAAFFQNPATKAIEILKRLQC